MREIGKLLAILCGSCLTAIIVPFGGLAITIWAICEIIKHVFR